MKHVIPPSSFSFSCSLFFIAFGYPNTVYSAFANTMARKNISIRLYSFPLHSNLCVCNWKKKKYQWMMPQTKLPSSTLRSTYVERKREKKNLISSELKVYVLFIFLHNMNVLHCASSHMRTKNFEQQQQQKRHTS